MVRVTDSNSKTSRNRRSFGRSLLNGAVYITVMLAIIFGFPKLLSKVLDTPYPMAAITSGSMWPVLKEGDLVFIKGVHAKDEITVGDIVVYRNTVNNTLTIHRVAAMGEKKVTTKGDANFNEDTSVGYENVLGKAVTILGKPLRVPYMGSVTVFASNLKE